MEDNIAGKEPRLQALDITTLVIEFNQRFVVGSPEGVESFGKCFTATQFVNLLRGKHAGYATF